MFRLTPSSGGGAWMLETLFSFAGGAESGEPNWIVGSDRSRPLYVSTSLANGVVVEISPPASTGKWTERVIMRFGGNHGGRDTSNLVMSSSGSKDLTGSMDRRTRQLP